MEDPKARANVFFIGLMGAGKTTVGRAIAKRLDRPFYDSDHEIEARTGVKIPIISNTKVRGDSVRANRS